MFPTVNHLVVGSNPTAGAISNSPSNSSVSKSVPCVNGFLKVDISNELLKISDIMCIMFKELVFILILLFPLSAHAHPHVRVNASVELLFDNKKLTGIKQSWVFDDLFSTSVIQDYDKDKNGKFSKGEIEQIQNNAFINLKNYDFYNHVFKDEKTIKITGFKDFSASLDNEIVTYTFTTLIAESLDIKNNKVAIGFYDPEYYVDIFYQSENPVQFNGINGCYFQIKEDKKHSVYAGLVNPKTIYVDCK